MSVHDVDGLNTGYARALLDDYLENPAAVPPEWRALFESGESDELLATHPGVARLFRGSRGACRERPQAVCDGRGRRDGARQGPPDARPSCGAARSARVGAGRRSGARPAPPRAEADAGAAGAGAGVDPPHPRRGRDARRGAAAAPGDLLRLDGVRDRAHRRPRAARVAAPGDRVVALPPAAERGRAAPALHAPLRGRGHRALPAPGVPRPEAVLARGPRRADPDARRGDRARRRRSGARGRDRDGAPRPPQRARAHDRHAVRADPARVRGRADDRSRRRRSPRAAPATSSTTSAPRAFARPRPARSASRWPPTRATSRRSTRSSRAGRAPSRPIAAHATARTTRRSRCRSSCTATPRSRARGSSPRR